MAAPTIASNISSLFANAAAATQDIATAGLSWSAGQKYYSLCGTSSTANVTGVAGLAGDDTFTELAEAGAGESRAWLHEGTVGGGALDGTVRYTIDVSRRLCAALMLVSGSGGKDPHASNPAINQGVGPTVPTSAAFTVNNTDNLIITCCNIRGGHDTSPPAAPSGYTILGTAMFNGATESATNLNSMTVATKTQAAAGAVAAATWGGLTGLGTQPWSTIHFAVSPTGVVAEMSGTLDGNAADIDAGLKALAGLSGAIAAIRATADGDLKAIARLQAAAISAGVASIDGNVEIRVNMLGAIAAQRALSDGDLALLTTRLMSGTLLGNQAGIDGLLSQVLRAQGVLMSDRATLRAHIGEVPQNLVFQDLRDTSDWNVSERPKNFREKARKNKKTRLQPWY